MSDWSKKYIHLCGKLHNAKTAIQQLSGAVQQARRHDPDGAEELKVRLDEVIGERNAIDMQLAAMRHDAKRGR